ncbi:MAG TPA: hypothetical protein VGC10_06035 [Sphingomonas sp.]
MTGLRRAAETIARTGIHPVLTAERLFASERVAAGLDALRVAPFEPWDELVARALADISVLSAGELRRLIDGVWRDPAPGRLAIALAGAVLARGGRSGDRALIEAWLRHYPRDHGGFDALREAAATAAGRHDWAWRERGRRWRLWAEDAPALLRAAIADGGEADALLAEAGLTGTLAHGAFADAVRAAHASGITSTATSRSCSPPPMKMPSSGATSV